MDDSTIIVFHLVALLIASMVFARILAIKAVRKWQKTHNKTWAMVVTGAVLILADIGSLVLWGIADQTTWALTILACCVCGAPIVHGEKVQDAKESAIYEAAQRSNTEEHPR